MSWYALSCRSSGPGIAFDCSVAWNESCELKNLTMAGKTYRCLSSILPILDEPLTRRQLLPVPPNWRAQCALTLLKSGSASTLPAALYPSKYSARSSVMVCFGLHPSKRFAWANERTMSLAGSENQLHFEVEFKAFQQPNHEQKTAEVMNTEQRGQYR